jgi:hypothetical protein
VKAVTGHLLRTGVITLTALALTTGCMRLMGAVSTGDGDPVDGSVEADLDTSPEASIDSDFDVDAHDAEHETDTDVETDGDRPVVEDPGWFAPTGGVGASWAFEVETTGDGGAIVVGHHNGPVDLDPGPGERVIFGSGLYLVKLTPEGLHEWSLAFEINSFVGVAEVFEASDRDILLLTAFSGTVVIEPGRPEAVHHSQGDQDLLLIRIARNGAYIWSRSWGSTGVDSPHDVAVAADGSALASFSFADSIDLDPGPVEIMAPGPQSALVKLTAAGVYDWSRTTEAQITTLEIEGGRILAGGTFRDSVDLDLGPGSRVVTAEGAEDGFFAVYDRDVNLISFFTLSGPGSLAVEEFERTSIGDIVLCGRFAGVADFDPGPAVVAHDARGLIDMFVSRHSSDGSLGWVVPYGEPGTIRSCTDVAVQRDGGVVTATYFSDSVDLDPGPGVAEFTPGANSDGFLIGFHPDGGFRWARHLDGTLGVVVYDLDISRDLSQLYVAGMTQGPLDVDLGPGARMFEPEGPNSGFVLRLPVVNVIEP